MIQSLLRLRGPFLGVLFFVVLKSWSAWAGRPARILLGSVDVGFGHLSFEQGLNHVIQNAWGDQAQTTSIELISTMTPFYQRATKGQYMAMIKHFPKLFDFYFNQVAKLGLGIDRAVLAKAVSPDLERRVRDLNPDLVLSTHPFVTLMMEALRERGALRATTQVVTFVTDFAMGKLYDVPGLLVVPHPSLQDQAIAMGRSAESVAVINGLLVRPEFFQVLKQDQERDRTEWRRSLQLDPDKPVLVVSGGGEGLGLDGFLSFLPRWRPDTPLQVIIVTGRNVSLRRDLEALAAHGRLHPFLQLRVTGFIRNMHEYMAAADAICTKPGGSTLAEAIALRLPVFTHMSLPGHEKHNFDLLEPSGVIAPLQLNDLNQTVAFLTRAAAMKERIARAFPNLEGLPAQILGIIRATGAVVPCEAALDETRFNLKAEAEAEKKS